MNRDGIVKIEISPDEMSATAYITPPAGDGAPLSLSSLKQALFAAGVVYGLKDDYALEKHLDEARTRNVQAIVARGSAPGHSTDASIEYPWMKDAPERDDLADDDKVDLRELHYVKTVIEQEIIAIKTPARDGEDGSTVTGKKTPGPQGKDVTVKIGPNVAVSDDGLEYYATASGTPKLANKTLSVDPVFVVNRSVDYHTGNINFIGDVEIKGDILDGFVVKAGGNIVVSGNIQKANVIAGGNIIVNGGIITRMEGYVMAEGDIHAKYIENSIVEAEGDVTSTRAIINSFVRANGSVHCTSKEGKIVGGDIMAFEEIRAKVLGTELETTTILRAGYDFKSYLKLNEEQEALTSLNEQLQDAEKSLNTLKKDTEKSATIAKLNHKIKELTEKKTKTAAVVDDLKKSMKTNKSAAIRGEDAMYSGSVAHIGNAKLKISHTMKYTTLTADKEDAISISAFDSYASKAKKKKEKEEPKPAEEKKVETAKHAPQPGKPLPPKQEEKPAGPYVPTGLPTVLVVDDTDFYRKRLSDILRNSNFEVIGEASNGKDAIRQFVALKPDVVTLDIMMPQIDGVTALKLIMRVNPAARVIMISSTSDKEKMTESVKAGAKDFIMKPFSAAKVVEVMHRVLA